MQARKYLTKYLWQLTFACSFLISNNIFAAQTEFKKLDASETKSRLIASFYEENGQKKLIAGFEIDIENGWKIYAPDDYGFGIPPSFSFVNSSNIDTTKFIPIFPQSITKKEKIGDDTIKYSVYKDKVIIPIELKIFNTNQSTNLEIEVSYALCQDICIPINQKFSLLVPALDNDLKALQNIQKFLPAKQIIIPEAQSTQSKNILTISLIKALFIAFVGGAILNIMPCVLPVLSIKLLGIINHSNEKINRIRFAFFSTILGIIFTFLLFACVTIFLQSIGSAVGWGLQFQNSYFLIFLLIILTIFTANLIGLFEFNFSSSVGSIINKKITKEEWKKNIFIPNFLSGILAVLLATPCSAPFVGVAISFALSSNVWQIFLIFISMSLGLSLPYLVLIILPNCIKFLPKSGNWLINIKHLMVGLLASTIIWLIYVLIGNIGFLPAMSAAILSILILLFFKIIHKINYYQSTFKIILLAIIFIALISAIFIAPHHLATQSKIIEQKQENWIKFDETKITELVLQGKVVVIDITADWCISCKVNKFLVLDNNKIKEKLREPNIVAMRGDLTNHNQQIFEFMKKHNRYGIPFNIVFGPSAPNGILVSELLNKKSLLKAIKMASAKN
jgi:suppressor for copper-sensitivity B